MGAEWNTRYVAFARENGRTPEAQLAHDREKPGRNVDFMLWIAARWREWRNTPGCGGGGVTVAEHHAFDAWLDARGAVSP